MMGEFGVIRDQIVGRNDEQYYEGKRDDTLHSQFASNHE